MTNTGASGIGVGAPIDEPHAEVTFNVVFIRGSAARLLPFTLSLSQQEPDTTFRLVDNGGSEEDSRLLRAAADHFAQLEYFRPESRSALEHGDVLNAVFETYDEPVFAIVDSDVCASGAFLDDLYPLGENCAGTFGAPPVWAEDADTVAVEGCTWIGARQRTLPSGLAIGNTYCAVYDRQALERVWDEAPRGFMVQDRYMLSPTVRRRFGRRGWRFTTFDTSRLLNLLLIDAGYRLENRRGLRLHHVGGLSALDLSPRNETVLIVAKRLLRELPSRSSGARALRLWDGLRHRLFMWRSRRQPAHREMNHRRAVVSRFVSEWLSAAARGRTPPPVPDTGSVEVDQKLHALADALREFYVSNLATCRALVSGVPH